MFQIIVRAQGRMNRAGTQGRPEDLLGLIATDNQRQVLVLLVKAMEQDQLLLAVTRIIRRVEIQGDPSRRFGERTNELVNKEVMQPPEGGNIDGILETRERRLTGQVIVLWLSPSGDLENGVAPEGVVVVAVFVASQDAEDTLANHLGKGVLGLIRVPWVLQAINETLGKADLAIELPQG